MMGVDNEVVRAVLVLALVFGSATFILAAVKFVFSFGKMVKGQEDLTAQAREASESFKRFAAEIHKIIEGHEGRIAALELERQFQERLDAERKRRNELGGGV